MRSFSYLVALLPLFSQAKRPVTFADYDSWNRITSSTISNDGKWVAYALQPQVGDGQVVAHEIASGKEIRASIGMQPPRSEEDNESGEERRAPVRGPKVEFSADSRFVIAQTYPPKGRKPAGNGGMAILSLAAGTSTVIEDVKSFNVPEDGGGVIAYLSGKRLALRPLGGAAARVFEGVSEYALSRDGAVALATGDDFVIAIDTASGAKTMLKSGKARYARLTFDFDEQRAAFLADGAIYGWKRGESAAAEWAKGPFADRAGLSFTRDGKLLQAGLANTRRGRRGEAEPKDDKAVFELWHWKDDRAQTIQKARAAIDGGRAARVALHIADKKLVTLSSDDVSDFTFSDEGGVVLGYGDKPYLPMREYDGPYRDVYIVNPLTGEKKLAVKKLAGMGGATLSPDGKWAVYYDKKSWWALNTATAAVKNLAPAMSFANELSDTPQAPGSNGSAGWTKDGKWFVVYDRYDVWALSPEAAPRNVTNGAGRRTKTVFRVSRARVDRRDRGIDTTQPILLSAVNEATRDSGFYKAAFDGAAPAKLIMEPRAYSAPRLARNADVALLTASRFDQFPDLQVTDSNYERFKKISDANPLKKEMKWGTAELISYRSTQGVPLQGILYKPEDFDQTKKYPMLVYIYERLSNGLHAFVAPEPSHSLNRALYVSNGYLMLYADIAYTTGYPGESALQCVSAAVKKVVDMGIVDEKKIGIQGHSWGGYQIAYMVTRTNVFAAAAPGALVANMTSAYDGIRYGPGLPRQFQYETGQSRIGGSLWQYPTRYLDNSPIFRADKVRTPLLMLHNDRDDAVPFTQGLEFFLALRRLGKEVYFFNYNGEPHGIRKRVNQRDYAIRQFEFFNHFLKGAKKPAWMERGIPYLDRDKPEMQGWRPETPSSN
jgi:dipeptidyl aminopeptidase/acylaminoacyl peptidase